MCTEIEVSSEKDNLMKCKDCPSIFSTNFGLKVHSRNQHKNNKETKLDQLQNSPTNENEIVFDENSEIEEKCPFCKLCFENKIYLQIHKSNEHNKLTQPNKGKKLYIYKANVFQCQKCRKYFGQNSNLRTHIVSVHENMIMKDYDNYTYTNI